MHYHLQKKTERVHSMEISVEEKNGVVAGVKWFNFGVILIRKSIKGFTNW